MANAAWRSGAGTEGSLRPMKWGGAERRGAGALEERRDLTVLEVKLLREHVQVHVRLGQFRLQLFLDLAEAVGSTVAAQLRLKIRTRLLEGLALGSLHFIEADDV